MCFDPKVSKNRWPDTFLCSPRQVLFILLSPQQPQRGRFSPLPLSFFRRSTVFKADRTPARFAGLPVTFLAMSVCPFLINGHHCGAETRNEFTPAKTFRPLCSDSLKWHKPCDEWSKTQDKWSNPAQSYIVLSIEKMNQINTKNYWN